MDLSEEDGNGMCQSLYLFTDSRGLHAEAHVELIGLYD